MINELSFPLEEQIPDREICEEMKRLGFPQDTTFVWVQYGDKCIVQLRLIVPSPRHVVAAPLVGEILEWLIRQGVDKRDIPFLRVVGSRSWMWAHRWRRWSNGWGEKAFCADGDAEISTINAYARTCLALLKAMKDEADDSSETGCAGYVECDENEEVGDGQA